MLGRCEWCGSGGQLFGMRWSLMRLTEEQSKDLHKKIHTKRCNWLCRTCRAAALAIIHHMRAKVSDAVPNNH